MFVTTRIFPKEPRDEKPYLSFIPVNFCQRRCLILPDEELTPVAPTNRGNEAHESPAGNLEEEDVV